MKCSHEYVVLAGVQLRILIGISIADAYHNPHLIGIPWKPTNKPLIWGAVSTIWISTEACYAALDLSGVLAEQVASSSGAAGGAVAKGDSFCLGKMPPPLAQPVGARAQLPFFKSKPR